MNNDAFPRPLAELEEKIGYRFENGKLLEQALTHSSYGQDAVVSKKAKKAGKTAAPRTKRSEKPGDYERLEFLGDAVLEATVSEYLYHRYPTMPEGELTKHRARMVCETALAAVATEYGFGEFLRMSRGEEKTGGRKRASILCDVTEAIIGAVTLDSSRSEAEKLIERLVIKREEELLELTGDNKTKLQELLQAQGTEMPVYTEVSKEGPPHNPVFGVELSYGGKIIGRGSGKSKKEAEQRAAGEALRSLRNEETVWN